MQETATIVDHGKFERGENHDGTGRSAQVHLADFGGAELDWLEAPSEARSSSQNTTTPSPSRNPRFHATDEKAPLGRRG
jgi:hypothetical protein